MSLDSHLKASAKLGKLLEKVIPLDKQLEFDLEEAIEECIEEVVAYNNEWLIEWHVTRPNNTTYMKEWYKHDTHVQKCQFCKHDRKYLFEEFKEVWNKHLEKKVDKNG